MTESYADYPLSIAEAKANAKEDGRLLTARDTLIGLLREIDSGEIEHPAKLMVVLMHPGEDRVRVGYRSAGCSRLEAVGMVEQAKMLLYNVVD